MKLLKLCGLLIILFLAGCQTATQETIHPIDSSIEVKKSDGSKSDVISHANIVVPKVSLTFNGLADNDTMKLLLTKLDESNMKATFFLDGMRVAQEPELVKDILKRGHEVQNGTLTFPDVSTLNYEQTYEEIMLTNQIFEEHLGYTPKFVRSRSGDVTDNMRLAAKALDMKAVIGLSINPLDRKMQSAQELINYISKYIDRGSIIHLNTYINPAIIDAIPLLAQLAKEREYTITTLSDLLDERYLTKSVEEIAGYDAVSPNLNYEQVQPNLYYRKETTKKEIAITFDDWAHEKRVKEVLDVLRKYNIKSTFFLIGSGVEKNPQLAKMIVEEGHEVASHSYYHLDVTKMTPEDLQADLVKAHQALTYALQEPPLLYFRPAQGIMDERTAKIITAAGIKTIAMYDIASFDWNLDYSAQDIYDRVISRVAPGKVIVMHILDGTNTVEALPLIIEKLLEDGYSFSKMSTWIEEDSNRDVNEQ
ncbi:polysaccharide deacetylase family protein [Lysinibacillus irui]|uniref:Polysaccharide deacetylase family protein n=1 Tax=Lysinibacillus irui TaxID=2998077 RepID=A0ABU5NIN1_9BACI|nr:polysaccharide deacetylase family protein [Lysinibacillus irui]MEA0553496.1 polysaccharide deacetylase family protein [Lysinibacillus irui]MEA0975879.1 polysaccharide deacetylase family protein [Lysinibacillus irui]MEA1042033.1 polysaccharide deacetylase family protein [Lysinibacillus irui]